MVHIVRYGHDTSGGRSASVYWEGKSETLASLPDSSKNVPLGILLLPPPVGEITFALGLWEDLNNRLGAWFDLAEDETIEPETLLIAASTVASFTERICAGDDVLKVKVGERIQPDPGPIIAEISSADLRKELNRVREFFLDAASLGKAVTVSL